MANSTGQLIVAVVREVARTLGERRSVPALRDNRLADVDIADEVAVAASYHAVVPLLWAAIERNDAPDALRAAVRAEYLSLVARVLRLEHLLRVVDDALTSAAVPYAVYKGPATAAYYPSPELRAFSDIDVLVGRQHLGLVDDALHDIGFTGGWSGVPHDYAETGYHLTGFGTLDLHWHVMREADVRAAYALDTTAMLERAERRPHADGNALMLDAVDEVIAVATHACFDGAYRLGWTVDVAHLLRAESLDHDELQRRCAQTRTALPVQVIVDRTNRALGTYRGEPLVRGAWRSTLNGLTAVRPVERTFRQIGRGGLVFRSTRPTSRHSFAALLSLTYREALRPALSDPNHRWRTGRKRRL